MKVTVTIEIGPEENLWLELHNGCKGRRREWAQYFYGVLRASLEDLQGDYSAHLEAEEMKAHADRTGEEFYNYSQFKAETRKE
jgi:hypothetical protein